MLHRNKSIIGYFHQNQNQHQIPQQNSFRSSYRSSNTTNDYLLAFNNALEAFLLCVAGQGTKQTVTDQRNTCEKFGNGHTQKISDAQNSFLPVRRSINRCTSDEQWFWHSSHLGECAKLRNSFYLRTRALKEWEECQKYEFWHCFYDIIKSINMKTANAQY